MNTQLAPAVESILRATRDRGDPSGSVQADARSFGEAVARADSEGRTPVVAEVKPTSPTTDGRREVDPAAAARAMVAGGATAISVLTEPDHFGGSVESLRAVRDAVDVPVLRKDFLLREAQLDAVAADLVLLIVRFVDSEADATLGELIDAARERGMEPLVEVHTREEAERAVEAGADVIGVNNRDLAELRVDTDTFAKVAPVVPDDVTLLAESGIGTAETAREMRTAGADALLIGSAIMDGVDDAHGGEGSDETDDGGESSEAVIETNTRRFTTAETEETV